MLLSMTLHLTRSSRLWTFQLLGFEVFQVRLQKKNIRKIQHVYNIINHVDFFKKHFN
jgi:hypothetical protein